MARKRKPKKSIAPSLAEEVALIAPIAEETQRRLKREFYEREALRRAREASPS